MALMDTDMPFPQAGGIVEIDSDEVDYVLELMNGTGIELFSSQNVRRLQGGVSSDVWLMDCLQGNNLKRYVIKQPLATLRVQKNWSAPLKRAFYENLWLEMASRVSAESVPHVYYFDEKKPLLVTQYIDVTEAEVWQRQLFSGRFDLLFVQQLGEQIAIFHEMTAGSQNYAREFNSADILRATRIEPYIFALIDTFPDMSERLVEIGESVLANRISVIHGDLSPKNILNRDSKPVFLDAECACYADPAFDIAFCINHLLLKFYRLGDARFILMSRLLATSYLQKVNWEDRTGLEKRIAVLIPVLMLARIDGKSTLHYLNECHKKTIRKKALNLLTKNLFSLDFIFNEVAFTH
ncbi:TPA: phosphotransferase family protein [Enterobacter asburiae]